MSKRLDIIEDGSKITDELERNMDTYQQKQVYQLNGKEYMLTKSRASLNGMLLNSLPGEMQREEFMYLGEGSTDELEDYQQRIVNHLFDEREYSVDDVKEVIYEVKEAIMKHTRMFNFWVNIDISMYDFVKMMRDDDRMKDIIMNEQFDEEMNAYEVIEKKEELEEYVKEYSIENKVDPFYTMIDAGAGMRLEQYFDILIGVGIRPYREEIYPFIINESWLTGLKTKKSFWAENDSARNALILQKLHIRDTGTFNKRNTMLSQPSYLNDDSEFCCDSNVFVQEDITDENFERFIDCYIQVDEKPYLITDDDTQLIGQTVDLRQPMTCNSDDGICHFCIGNNLYFDNLEGYKGGQRNLGAAVTKQKVAPKVQGYLSAKHNNTANLVDIEIKPDKWNEIFDIKYLNTIIFKDNLDISWIEVIEDEYKKEKIKGEKFDCQSSESLRVKVNGDEIVFEANSYFFTPEENIKENNGRVKKLDDIHLKIPNAPVSSGYHKLNQIYNKNDGDWQWAIDEMKKLMSDDKIVIPYLLIRNLIRDPEEPHKRPDFHVEDGGAPKMEMTTMLSALKNMRELGLKMNVGWFGKMISDVNNYIDTRPSKFDILFESRQD